MWYLCFLSNRNIDFSWAEVLHLHCFVTFWFCQMVLRGQKTVKDERGGIALWPACWAVIYYLMCHAGWMGAEGRAEETFTSFPQLILVQAYMSNPYQYANTIREIWEISIIVELLYTNVLDAVFGTTQILIESVVLAVSDFVLALLWSSLSNIRQRCLRTFTVFRICSSSLYFLKRNKKEGIKILLTQTNGNYFDVLIFKWQNKKTLELLHSGCIERDAGQSSASAACG